MPFHVSRCIPWQVSHRRCLGVPSMQQTTPRFLRPAFDESLSKAQNPPVLQLLVVEWREASVILNDVTTNHHHPTFVSFSLHGLTEESFHLRVASCIRCGHWSMLGQEKVRHQRKDDNANPVGSLKKSGCWLTDRGCSSLVTRDYFHFSCGNFCHIGCGSLFFAPDRKRRSILPFFPKVFDSHSCLPRDMVPIFRPQDADYIRVWILHVGLEALRQKVHISRSKLVGICILCTCMMTYMMT